MFQDWWERVIQLDTFHTEECWWHCILSHPYFTKWFCVVFSHFCISILFLLYFCLGSALIPNTNPINVLNMHNIESPVDSKKAKKKKRKSSQFGNKFSVNSPTQRRTIHLTACTLFQFVPVDDLYHLER